MPRKPIVCLAVVITAVAGLTALAILSTGGAVIPPDLPSREAGDGTEPPPLVKHRPGARTTVPPPPRAPEAEAKPVGAPEPAAVEGKRSSSDRPDPLPPPPPACIHGTVRDSSAEPHPVAGARVVLASALGEASALTDRQGRFRFTPLPPGDYVIRAFHAAFAPWVQKGSGERIILVESESRHVSVTLEVGVMVRGIVIARDGTGPVGGARVTMVRGEYDRFVTTRTSRDGSFTFAHFPLLPPNERPFPIEVIADGFSPKYLCIRTRKPSEHHRLEIELDRGAGVLGLVTDLNGAPLQGVDVRCRFRYLYVKKPSEISGRTDNLGRYRLKHLPRGYTIQVWAFKEGYRPSYLNLIVNGHAERKFMRPLRLKRLTKS